MHKIKYYFLNELNFHGRNAGFKARVDALTVFSSNTGVQVVNIPLWGGVWSRLKNTISFLNFILLKLKSTDVLFIQYPFPKPFIDMLTFIIKHRNIKLCLLIHDVDIFRGQGHNKDFKNLTCASFLISHNERMSVQLNNVGVTTPKINLQIFDYILKDKRKILVGGENSKLNNIIYCGNLDRNKSGFIYSWGKGNLNRIVYGVNADDDININNDYRGSFDANFPPEIENIGRSFGLVWDGDSINECSGSFGEYLKFNNPHKTSLYLAMGLPVIVWKDAAISQFVKMNGVGIIVDGLNDLERQLELITFAQYSEMLNNVVEVRKKITAGWYLNESINYAMTLCSENTNMK
ncbi:beta-1,6-galactofuranosyltransferase [Klebsiella pneumoniae]|nr:beta-1,6-galactofuranosyltransferase [Klebsiella pneumoniae]